jgi:hypothetical protein
MLRNVIIVISVWEWQVKFLLLPSNTTYVQTKRASASKKELEGLRFINSLLLWWASLFLSMSALLWLHPREFTCHQFLQYLGKICMSEIISLHMQLKIGFT